MTNLENMIMNRMKKQMKNKKLIKKMLSDLSLEDRFILVSREIENFSFKEIALITGRKADELRKHFRQLKDVLKKQLIQLGTKNRNIKSNDS